MSAAPVISNAKTNHTPAERDTATLYIRYGALVHRRAQRFFGPDEAEDVVHEVFLTVHKRIDSFRGDSHPATWLYRVTTNLCLARLAKQQRRERLWQDHSLNLEAPCTQSASQEAAVVLADLLDKLPRDLALIGVYAHVDGLSQEEIGRLMGISRRTVYERLNSLSWHLKSGRLSA